MATIKAGTYRFNDVLISPSAGLEQIIAFEVSLNIGGVGEVNANCSKIKVEKTEAYNAPNMQFYVLNTTPNIGLPADGAYSTVYFAEGDEWTPSIGGIQLQTIVIPEDAEVSDEFATWFAANTTSEMVLPEDKTNILYDGKCIASLEAGQTATLPCEGKEMATDIAVIAPKSGGDGEFPADRYFEGGYAEVNLPNATKIKQYSFYYDANLTNINMPNVTSIGQYAFYCCSNLALTELPSGLTSIGSSAFHSCANLALTELPSGLTSIKNYAFHSIPSLETITFKGQPQTIANGVFSGCNNLKTINVPWAEGAVAYAPWGATNATINYNYKG